MRDHFQGQSYGAERHAFFDTLMYEQCDFASLVRMTREVEATAEWREVYGERAIDIGHNPIGNQDFARGYSEISYKTSSWRFAVPHEMAHLLTNDGHGPQWRAQYVWLVRLMYGDLFAEPLLAGFRGSKLATEILPLARVVPVYPPELFVATVGSPLFTKRNDAPARGPIAL